MKDFDFRDICIGTEEFCSIHSSYRNSIINFFLAGTTFPDNRYRIYHEDVFHVFEYVCSGQGHIIQNGMTYDVKAGDFYLMPLRAKCFYYADHRDPFKKKWFNIGGSLISALLKAYGISDTELFIKHIDVEDLFDSILAALPEPDGKETQMAHHLLSLVSAVARDKEVPSRPNVIESVVQYLNRNIRSQLRLEEVADHFHISRVHLIHIFKEKYGITPYDYYLKRKIRISKELLSNTEMPIKQIAYELAFSDSHHFSTAFKKICGISPKEYRKIRGKKS